MLLAILILLQLADSDGFVRFERCFLDFSVSPPQFRPYDPSEASIARDVAFSVRRSAVLYVSDPEGGIAGIKCSRIGTANGAAFVQGTSDDIKRILEGH